MIFLRLILYVKRSEILARSPSIVITHPSKYRERNLTVKSPSFIVISRCRCSK